MKRKLDCYFYSLITGYQVSRNIVVINASFIMILTKWLE